LCGFLRGLEGSSAIQPGNDPAVSAFDLSPLRLFRPIDVVKRVKELQERLLGGRGGGDGRW
jgi:hypothetical protein